MGKSGDPRKAPKVSSVSEFKRKQGGVFELPSGLTMKLKNPGGLRVFMKGGVIPNSLMSVVTKSLEGNQPTEEDFVDPEKGFDPQMIDDMMVLLDHIMVTCSVEPKVHEVPSNEDDRDDDLLYTDEITDEDKMFVFQWVSGGTSDLETFRQRHAQNVDSLGRGSAMGMPRK